MWIVGEEELWTKDASYYISSLAGLIGKSMRKRKISSKSSSRMQWATEEGELVTNIIVFGVCILEVEVRQVVNLREYLQH